VWLELRSAQIAFCHSRNLRQQVEPDPQPIYLGSQDQGKPVRRTKVMPRSTLRLEMRGRLPLGLAGSGGRRGPTTAHSSSIGLNYEVLKQTLSATDIDVAGDRRQTSFSHTYEKNSEVLAGNIYWKPGESSTEPNPSLVVPSLGFRGDVS
jgi:hypothetical protein